MDGLSVAASIAGLITIADIVVGRGYRYLKDVKDAKKSIGKLITEVNNLVGVLHSLKNVADRFEDDNVTIESTIQIHYVESCYRALETIQRSLDATDPSNARTPIGTAIKQLRWPLTKSSTTDLILEIERHKTAMTLALSADGMMALLQSLAKQDNIRYTIDDMKRGLDLDRTKKVDAEIDAERKKMLDFLSTVDASKWQDTNIRLRQPGTGIWFTDGIDFKSWLAVNESKLWMYGIPGAGKTMLISSIIQEALKYAGKDHALSFFYCDYKDPNTQNSINILGSIARQISTLIIVDGLDEISKNRTDVTQLLAELNQPSGKVKTLFASRLEVDIKCHLKDYVQLSIAAQSSDLRLYVASEIARRKHKLRIKDPCLTEHIMKKLVDGADGMFRWVACQMDFLCDCDSDRDRREALERLPPDLPSSYIRILERANKGSKATQKLVSRTLQWIVYAKLSLDTKTLLQALSIQPGDDCLEATAIPTVDDVLYWCSSLICENSFSKELELAHFTVKEFLMAIDPKANPELAHYQLSSGPADIMIAQTCLLCLNWQIFENLPIPMNFEAFRFELSKIQEEYPIHKYASKFWDLHARHSIGDACLVQLTHTLFDPRVCNRFRHWALFRLQTEAVDHYDRVVSTVTKLSPLHMAASLALPELCEWLIRGGASIQGDAAGYGTPLWFAVLGPRILDEELDDLLDLSSDHETTARISVIQILLDAGSDADNLRDCGADKSLAFAALYSARFNDDPAILPLLLNAGASISVDDMESLLSITQNTVTSEYGVLFNPVGALSLFVNTMSTSMVNLKSDMQEILYEISTFFLRWGTMTPASQTILNFDFERRFSDDLFQKIVEYFADWIGTIELEERGLERSVVDCFLHNVQKNAGSDFLFKRVLWNRLPIAIKHSYIEFKEFLVDKILDISIVGKDGDTPLHLALRMYDDYRDLEVIQSIIDRNKYSAVPNKLREIPLHVAAEHDDIELMDLIWKSSELAALEAQTINGRTPLKIAIESKNEKATRFLLEKHARYKEMQKY